MVQALRPNDRRKRVEFCDRKLQNMEDDTFLPRLIFSDEAAFHPNGKVSGFGGLKVACWPLVPKFAGSNQAEAVGFFRAKKSSARLPSKGK